MSEVTNSRFYSYAEWDKHIPGFHQRNTTRDEHDTQRQAEAVCDALKRDGLGGEGKFFPLRTWTELIKEGGRDERR